MQSIEVVLQRL